MENNPHSFLREFYQSNRKSFFNFRIILLMDLVIMTTSTSFAYWLVSYFKNTPPHSPTFIWIFISTLVVSLITVTLFNTFRHTIRHSRMRDLWRISSSILLKTLLLFLLITFINPPSFSDSKEILLFVLIDGMLTFISIINIRLLLILCYDALSSSQEKYFKRKNVLCYGIGNKCVSLKIRLSQSPHYKIVGYYKYGKTYHSYKMAGIPVYYFTNKLDFFRLTQKRRIEGILFTNQEDVLKEKDRLIRYCEQYQVKALIAPSINEINETEFSQKNIRNIKIEDLLGREEICLNTQKLITGFSNKTVLVTGAAGSIGRGLCIQLAELGICKLLLFDSAETPLHNLRLELEGRFPQLNFVPIIGDVRSQARVKMVFNIHHPEIILHAAAYKHVPLMEENPCEAILANVMGTRNIADIAVSYGAEKMIMVSTDKAVNPTNVMGASKRLAEIYVQSLGHALKEDIIKGKTKFVTTRFGNVLGSNGSVIPRFREQIERGGPLTVTHPDIVRFFMTIPEACRLVLEAALMGNDSEIYVFEMGEPIKIVDLAARMIELAGFTPKKDIKIEFTGLRPGEKLYEEILSSKENSQPTHHKKINIAKVRKYEYREIVEKYDYLEELSRTVKIEDTVRLMKEIIPEFISNNSKFEKIDREKALIC